MIKKAIYCIVLALLLAIILTGIFLLQRRSAELAEPPDAIPGEAALVIKINDIREAIRFLDHESAFLHKGLLKEKVSHILEFYKTINSLQGEYPAVSEVISENPLYISYSKREGGEYSFLLYIEGFSGRRGGDIDNLIRYLTGDDADIETRLHRNREVKEAVLKNGEDDRKLVWSVSEGILIAGFSGSCVDNSIDELARGTGISGNESFRLLQSTWVSDANAHIYIDYGQLPLIISNLIHPQFSKRTISFGGIAEMAGLDIYFRDGSIMLNGFCLTPADELQYLDLFDDQHGNPVAIERIIPDNALFFVAFGLDDFSKFNSDYRDLLKEQGKIGEYLEKLKVAENKSGRDVTVFFEKNFEGEAALWYAESNVDEGASPFMALKLNDNKRAMQEIKSVAGINTKDTGSKLPGEKGVLRFPVPNLPELLFGRLFSNVETPYLIFLDDYVVFGGSDDGLVHYGKAIQSELTLDNNPGFSRYSKYLASGSNINLFFNLTLLSRTFSEYLNAPLDEVFEKNPHMPGDFRGVSIRFSSLRRNMIYKNAVFSYYSYKLQHESLEWQLLLDTLIEFKPQLVVNHHTGANEIFLQDMNNNIYLIDADGNILWRKKLPGPVLGSVYQIDFYRNGRLQMLFNTEKKIYLLDRNGNDVAGYPVKLPSPATTGISLFDYEGDGNYRIFIPSQDKNVYLFNKQGERVRGWEFEGTETEVHKPVQYFRTGGRDYIVFADLYNVYILDRRGNTRVSVPSSFPLSRNNYPIFEESPAPHLVVTDTLGFARYIYFNGEVEERDMGLYSAGHFFSYSDVDSDGQKELIFVDSRRVDVFKDDKTMLFSYEFEDSVTHRPFIYDFGPGNRKIGIVLQNKGKIYLLDSNGSVSEGFPLEGRSLFSVGFLDRERRYFSLITGGKHNFLYNYYVKQN